MMTRWASVSKNESLARCITVRNATVFRFKGKRSRRGRRRRKTRVEFVGVKNLGTSASMWCFFDFVVIYSYSCAFNQLRFFLMVYTWLSVFFVIYEPFKLLRILRISRICPFFFQYQKCERVFYQREIEFQTY